MTYVRREPIAHAPSMPKVVVIAGDAPAVDRVCEVHLRPLMSNHVCSSPLRIGFRVCPCVAVLGALNIMGCSAEGRPILILL